ncbi:hypothetical protein V2G26_018149 [Clonostachys chloroleuca]
MQRPASHLHLHDGSSKGHAPGPALLSQPDAMCLLAAVPLAEDALAAEPISSRPLCAYLLDVGDDTGGLWSNNPCRFLERGILVCMAEYQNQKAEGQKPAVEIYKV